MEYLDIVDEYGKPTGKTKERKKVHKDGDLHRTSHVWIARKNPRTKRVEILLQKRCDTKDSYPGCYDISSAGHIPAGEEYIPSALRELKEELGIEAKPEDLIFCFYHKGYEEASFYGEPFKNYEYSAVFLYIKPVEAENLKFQDAEVSAVKWADYEEILPEIMEESPKYCIFPDEFMCLHSHLKKIFHMQ